MKTRPEDQAAIDAHLARKGVTRCPTVAVAPVAGGVAASPETAKHGDALATGGWKAQRDRAFAATRKAQTERTQRRAPAREIGPPPELTWLPLAKLRVDPSYQRRIDMKHVRRLAEGFIWAAFKPLTVIAGAVRGEPIWWVVDGQHEAEAARLVGIDEVPCLVVTTHDQQRAAAAFVALNKNRKQITGADLYFAALVAKEPWALQIERILAAVGVTMIRQGAPKRMETKSVTSLRTQCARLGPGPITRALLIIKAAWPDEPNTFRERPILCIARLLAAQPGTMDQAVIRYAKATNSYQFERAVWGAAEQFGTEPAAALARLVNAAKA